jgi:hypothetical protein
MFKIRPRLHAVITEFYNRTVLYRPYITFLVAPRVEDKPGRLKVPRPDACRSARGHAASRPAAVECQLLVIYRLESRHIGGNAASGLGSTAEHVA